MSASRLKDLMPKRPRYYDKLSEDLTRRLTDVYHRLEEVPFVNKQQMEKWQERFCYSPEPAREIAVWEWLAGQYEKRTAGMKEQREKNRVFKQLLSESVNYEPLGVRKLPE